MKKLLTVFILLLSISAFAELKTVNLYKEIPIELRGTWYSAVYSEDKWKTEDKTYRPLLVVSRLKIISDRGIDVIESASKLDNNGVPGYALYSKDQKTVYIVVYYEDMGEYPILFVYKDKEEQYRSFVEIKRSE